MTSDEGKDGSTAPRAPSGARRVSVVIPAFNGIDVIGRTLESLAGQTYGDVEWIVVDDASHDGTSERVEQFLAAHAGRGRIVRHATNDGLARSLNDGVRLAIGADVLVLHQDIVLLTPTWIERAVADLDGDPRIAVVTGYYGIPAVGETTFAQRIFGVLRRQFHEPGSHGSEFATFSEFKCDLVRKSSLDAIGGFPERFRIAGEDLWVSYSLRERGLRILKDYSLPCVQRFTGDALSVRGNLRKEFLFGKVIAGTLLRFRHRVARGLQGAAYSRSRSLNRASQPIVVLGAIVLLALALLFGDWEFWAALVVLIVGRWAYYVARLAPGLRRLIPTGGRALWESLAGAALGLASDVTYSAGVAVGLLRWSRGLGV